MYLSSYDPQSQPLFYFKGRPVRLAVLLVLIHCAALLISALCGSIAREFLGLGAGRIHPDLPIFWPQWWQWGTYILNHTPSGFFLLDMFFLWRWGTEMETTFGRHVFAKLYAVLLLLPSAIAALFLACGWSSKVVLMGTHYSHFCLFVGMAFLHPDAPFFIPSIKLWWVALGLFCIYLLGDIGDRYWAGCAILIANTAATYVMMRRAGLTPRFGRVADAFSSAMPARRPQGKQKPAKRFEPKLVPKPDISPERTPVARIDAILEKISRSGIDSLDEWERRELERASTELKRQDL
jgi:membrane associated rhomboid family serine protease